MIRGPNPTSITLVSSPGAHRIIKGQLVASHAARRARIATQSALVFDFVSRQKVGSTAMGMFIWNQLPVPTPTMLQPHTGLTPRVLKLVYTAYDMTPLARDLKGWDRGALVRRGSNVTPATQPFPLPF